jgi:hypothetical protein
MAPRRTIGYARCFRTCPRLPPISLAGPPNGAACQRRFTSAAACQRRLLAPLFVSADS